VYCATAICCLHSCAEVDPTRRPVLLFVTSVSALAQCCHPPCRPPGIFPMITRRLDDEDRMALTSGCVYVWEERPNNPLEATGQEIQRFTEGRSWGPSRARDDFLLYFEKEPTNRSSILQRHNMTGSSGFVKQTYSVFVDSPRNSRKWHLNAYYTQATVDKLLTVDQLPILRDIVVPEGQYVCARTGGARRALRNRNHNVTPANGSTADTISDTIATNQHTPPPPAPPQFADPTFFMIAPQSDSAHYRQRRLAPLEYLQNISPTARDPIDDEALRCLSRGNL